MDAREHPGRLAFGLIALSLAAFQPDARAEPRAGRPAVVRPALDEEVRIQQRLIIKLEIPDADLDASQRMRNAQLAIAQLGHRLKPAAAGLDAVPMSWHGSIRPGLHVATTGIGLKRAEVQRLLERIRQDPQVEYAEIDERIHPQYTPDDPDFASQWNLWPPVPGTEGGANLPDAWELAPGMRPAVPGTVVAVLDTGIRPHRDLVGNILPGYDFVSDPLIANDGNGWDTDPGDPGDWVSLEDRQQATFANCGYSLTSSWHGTSMAGTIAAVGDNGLDIAGIAPAARILPVRVFGKCGGYVSDVIAGLFWSVGIVPDPPAGSALPPDNPNRARVINLSMAADGSCSHAFQEAIDLARARGAVVVAAAGNHASGEVAPTLGQPANCRGVIAVTAHTRRGDLASYANSHPDIALGAPGGGQGRLSLAGDGDWIIALSNSGSTTPLSDELGYMAGTSIAAAHVSGVAALLLGQQAGWSTDQIRLALTRSARAFAPDSHCYDGSFCGAGMLDAEAALVWQQANPEPPVPVENTGSSGGGGAAGWPELLTLLSAAWLIRLRRGRTGAST